MTVTYICTRVCMCPTLFHKLHTCCRHKHHILPGMLSYWFVVESSVHACLCDGVCPWPYCLCIYVLYQTCQEVLDRDHTVWTIDVLMCTACVHLLSASQHPDRGWHVGMLDYMPYNRLLCDGLQTAKILLVMWRSLLMHHLSVPHCTH